MSLKTFPDGKLLSDLEVLRRIHKALRQKKPFSLVRIGDGENIVLAQGKFLSNQKIEQTYWVQQGRRTGRKGVDLPNLNLRDRMLKGIKQADIVGICRRHNDEVAAPTRFKRELTNKIFDYYNLQPANLCYVFCNRKIVSYRYFWKLLHQYRTLLISKWADRYAQKIKGKYSCLPPQIIGTINFQHYDQIPTVLKKVGKYDFDLALISAGVNAVILAPAIAKRYKKVAIDFGKTMMYTVLPNKRLQPWTPPKSSRDGSSPTLTATSIIKS
ncbi:MAG TPA: hypothetical protein GXZ98_05565 [Firmicutes bacterium]|nr:hypothetical protein [Bacillota bacterium]